MVEEKDRYFEVLGLKEYESDALRELMSLGRTTAPNLSEATGIPKARIYGVLDSLAEYGYVEVIPGRPKEYQPKPPAEVLLRARRSSRREHQEYVETIDEIEEEFVDAYGPLYERASKDTTPTEELFHVVDVGEASETETRRLYDEARTEVKVLTKSFEYLPRVAESLEAAVERDVDVSAMFLHPEILEDHNEDVQQERYHELRERHPDVESRFAREKLPWRGTLVDPSMEYTSGQAVLLVEEEEVPLHMRQAAVTDNPSFVAGLSRYFELLWEHESVSPEEVY